MSYNPPNSMAFDDLPELSMNGNNEEFYNEPQSMFYDWPMSRRDYHPSPSPLRNRTYSPSPSPPGLRNAPFIGYWSPTHSSPPFHREPTQEPPQEPIQEPIQQQHATPPSPNQRSSSSSASDTTYSASSPSMPELEDQSYAQYVPFSDNDDDNDNDSESSDTEYTPSPTAPTEPGLEYDSSFASSSSSKYDSGSESDEDELAKRGRSRERSRERLREWSMERAFIKEENLKEAKKRAFIRERNEREARLRVAEKALREEVMAKVMGKTAVSADEGLDRSLKESLVALRVQELKKVAEDDEKKRATPRWISFLKIFLIFILLFVAAFAAVWVVNEVHYRGELPYVKLFRGVVGRLGTWQSW
ncbi:hypothetical protein VE02_00698 [Pseudogymnoascus sp. 03VT05]|nr:hypothetical protein VE02_00698 [Pseudogymnoascus sp. 03VT05]